MDIVNNAAVNIGVHILRDSAFSCFEYIPRSRLLDHMIILLLIC